MPGPWIVKRRRSAAGAGTAAGIFRGIGKPLGIRNSAFPFPAPVIDRAEVVHLGVAKGNKQVCGVVGTAAAHAVYNDRRVFVGKLGRSPILEYVIGNEDGAGQVEFGIFFNGAHVHDGNAEALPVRIVGQDSVGSVGGNASVCRFAGGFEHAMNIRRAGGSVCDFVTGDGEVLRENPFVGPVGHD